MRKSILAVAGTLVLGAAITVPAVLTSSTGSVAAVADRPNLVFVLTDDLSMNLLVHMPHVQQMQRTGTTLSNYHVTDSLCCPSRSAIFTGQYAHNNGVFTNSGADGGYDAFNRNGDQQKSFAVALQQNGYRTGFMGKYLNGYQPTDPVPPGWDEWDVAGNGYREFDYDLNENGKVAHYGTQPKDYLTDVVSGKAATFIRTSDKPFALEVATFAPHGPYTPAPRDRGTAATLAYPRTPAYDAAPAAPSSWLANRPALTTKQKTTLLTQYRKRVEAVQSVDDMIGNLQRTLAATGKAKNTYVVFSSDNGYHMGEYRLLSGKQTAFDTDIHVPLVVTGPKVAAGHVSDRLASNIDLAPTFEKLTGSSAGTNVDGADLTPLWRGQRPTSWQQATLVEHHGPGKAKDDPDRQGKQKANPPSYAAVRTADALYVEYANGQREYYDTRSDPYELRNIAAKGLPAALPRMLHALQRCQGTAACQAAAR